MINFNSTITRWGSWDVLFESVHHKVKLLTIKPGCGISLQRHFQRTEEWFVVNGQAYLRLDNSIIKIETKNQVSIPKDTWHQVWNFSTQDVTILEVQTGVCIEEDIERKRTEWL